MLTGVLCVLLLGQTGDIAEAHPGAVAVLRPGAKLEKVWSDGEFTEGPARAPDGAILFSDIGDRILRFDPATGATAEYRAPSGRSNGLAFTADGRLVAAEGGNTGGNRRVSVTGPDGEVRMLVDRFEGKRLNSPNDLTIDGRGRIYFSDPRYGPSEGRELEHESVYRIDVDGSIHRLETTARKPNGLGISPDGRTLYVADNGPERRVLLALELDPATGEAGRPRVLKDFGNGRGVDGMTVAGDGRIVAAAGAGKLGGVYVYEPDGTPVAFLGIPETPTNVELAGATGQDLYVTAGRSLYRIGTTLAAPTTRSTD